MRVQRSGWFIGGIGVVLMMLAAGITPSVAKDRDESERSIAGIELPQRIEFERQELQLNGAALRRIALIKIYVAGLYLPDKEGNAEEILSSDEPRSLVMHFLRNVDADRLCEGWDSSLEKNTPNPSEDLKSQFQTLCGWMEDARKGERLAFRYLPAQGTSVEINGRVKGPMAGKEFADALFRTWLGPNAIPGEDFKLSLLGQR